MHRGGVCGEFHFRLSKEEEEEEDFGFRFHPRKGGEREDFGFRLELRNTFDDLAWLIRTIYMTSLVLLYYSLHYIMVSLSFLSNTVTHDDSLFFLFFLWFIPPRPSPDMVMPFFYGYEVQFFFKCQHCCQTLWLTLFSFFMIHTTETVIRHDDSLFFFLTVK